MFHSRREVRTGPGHWNERFEEGLREGLEVQEKTTREQVTGRGRPTVGEYLVQSDSGTGTLAREQGVMATETHSE